MPSLLYTLLDDYKYVYSIAHHPRYGIYDEKYARYCEVLYLYQLDISELKPDEKGKKYWINLYKNKIPNRCNYFFAENIVNSYNYVHKRSLVKTFRIKVQNEVELKEL